MEPGARNRFGRVGLEVTAFGFGTAPGIGSSTRTNRPGRPTGTSRRISVRHGTALADTYA